MSKTFLATLIIAFQLISCSKDDTPTPANTTINGLWTGTYSSSANADLEEYFSLVFKPDGTLINETKGEAQEHLNIGTWTLSGNRLSCHVICVYGLPTNVGIEEDFTASFDKATGKITNGAWTQVTPGTAHGIFHVNKVDQ